MTRYYLTKIKFFRWLGRLIPEQLAYSLLILMGVVAFFIILVNLWPSSPL